MAIDYAGAIGDLGKIFGGAASGSAAQRVAEAPVALNADQVALRRQMLASLLGGVQDASVKSPNPTVAARTPEVTGGLRPSAMLGAGGMGGDGRREALVGQLNQPIDVGQKAGTAEKVMGTAGLLGSLLGPLMKLFPFGGGKDPAKEGVPAASSREPSPVQDRMALKQSQPDEQPLLSEGVLSGNLTLPPEPIAPVTPNVETSYEFPQFAGADMGDARDNQQSQNLPQSSGPDYSFYDQNVADSLRPPTPSVDSVISFDGKYLTPAVILTAIISRLM